MGPSQSREEKENKKDKRKQKQKQPLQPLDSGSEIQAGPSNPEDNMSSARSAYSTPHPFASSPHHHHHHHHDERGSLDSPSLSYPTIYHPFSIPVPPGTISTPILTKALTYISNRLLQKTKAHQTFIVTGDILFALFFRSRHYARTVNLIQTTHLSYKEKDIFITAVLKAKRKYFIDREDWLNNSAEVLLMQGHGDDAGSGGSSSMKDDMDGLIARSLKQREVVFSGDGMTLLAVDFVFELRVALWRFSRGLERGDGDEGADDGSREEMEAELENMVELVRRLVSVEGRGRGLKRSTIEARYGKLGFSDYAWMILGEEYERRFGEKGLKDDDHSDFEEDDEEEEEGILMAGQGERDSYHG